MVGIFQGTYGEMWTGIDMKICFPDYFVFEPRNAVIQESSYFARIVQELTIYENKN